MSGVAKGQGAVRMRLALAVPAILLLMAPAAGAQDLPMAREMRRGYDRAQWGDWEPKEGCMTTRHFVLARDSLVAPTIRNCKVVAGRWRDAWTGELLRDPKAIEIDHTVPVQEAHDSGGHAWPTDRRHQFFNDPENLVVTGRDTNSRKSGSGPETWLPNDPARRCDFVRLWVRIKTKWQLAADAREVAALREVVDDCPPPGAAANEAVAPSPGPAGPLSSGDLYR